MEGVQESASQVWWSVKFWLYCFTRELNFSSPISTQDLKLMEELQVAIPAQRQRRHSMVTWKKPPTVWFKLNYDGSCRGNSRN